ncbi:MAG: hypothetical protein JKY31_07600 [Rhodobacteraceae bacterium]|nr:hypothetical protein [Paracoccaceae bacterium]
MSMSVQRFLVTSAAYGAMVMFAGGHAASAQTTCEMTCLGTAVTACAAENSSADNWWEFGNGFQTCISFKSREECSASFVKVDATFAAMGSVIIHFSPLENDNSICQIPTTTSPSTDG